MLDRPPKKEEIEARLKRAPNTAPGCDKLEYRHSKALDPQAFLLEKMFEAVWRLGIPDSWRGCRTVPIYKKGSKDDYSNFRPISLLPTTYKLFQGLLVSACVILHPPLAGCLQSKKGSSQGYKEFKSMHISSKQQ